MVVFAVPFLLAYISVPACAPNQQTKQLDAEAACLKAAQLRVQLSASENARVRRREW